MQIVVGTAGHIDHGKTALVKALTGTDTDRLAEEKARGMTIDLGFAYLDQSITIIDVPGHEKFIRNMVAGVSTVHIALLVIAADDGIMPQTKEHLHILKLLGVEHGIIALTKTDIPDDKDWIDLVELEIQELVGHTFLKDAPIIRTSTETGEGVGELKSVIVELSKSIEAGLDRGFFHLPVDRVFSKTGFGTIVTGTVMDGNISTGDDVEIFPNGFVSKIRGIQTHGGETQTAVKGDRAALNIANIKPSQLNRGSVIATPGCIQNTSRIIAHVNMTNSTDWILKNKQRVRLHFGTSEIMGRVTGHPLEKGQFGNVILDLESPTALAMDDVFVIRSYSPMETIAGGRVLDPKPLEIFPAIKKMTSDLPVNPKDRFYKKVKEGWTHPITSQSWAKLFFISKDEIDEWISDKLKISESGLVYDLEKLEHGIDDLKSTFLMSYDNNPFRATLGSETLLSHLKWSDEWLDFVSTKMVNDAILKEESTGFSLIGHQPEFSQKDLDDLNRIESIISRSKYEPILTKEIVEESELNPKRVGDLVHLLFEQKKVENLGNNFWMNQPVLNQVILDLTKFFKINSSLAVSDFKDITGLSRKTAIPLLEYLDKKQITIRDGNVRLKGEMSHG